MIYEGCAVTAVYSSNIVVNLNGSAINVFLPDLMSRLPVVGDFVTISMDDVDSDRAVFVQFYNTRTVFYDSHSHYLSSDSEWDSIKEYFPGRERPKSGGVTWD